MSDVSTLPPNSTVLERALEATFAARLAALAVPVGQMMNPATCPAAILPWLAWAMSVDDWSSDWTEATQRAAIAASVAVHRRKGTRAALRAAIDAAGYGDAEIVERFGYRFYDGTRRRNGGNDNYARGAGDVVPATPWIASGSGGGVTITKTATGVDAGGIPWVEYTANGTGTGTAGLNLFVSQSPWAGASMGQQFTGSGFLSLVSGTVVGAGDAGLRLAMFALNASDIDTEGASMPCVRVNTNAVSSVTRTMTIAATAKVYQAVTFVVRAGVVFTDAVFRVSGVQLEVGAARTQIVPYVFDRSTPDHWAEYRLNLARPITIAQAAQVRSIADAVAPARCRLKSLTYTAAQSLYRAELPRDGTFTRGSL